MTRYAFHLDSTACSGCKACQVACKDKHDLPVGVLWRRVYEVTGGGWAPRNGAWTNDVYAYNLSMACNHCARPICLEVCPTAAIHHRPDGLVLIDPDRCMGCRYCEWACPYGALQYDAGAGRMTKCTLCVDELDAGRPPACVAACPLRVLDIETVEPADGERHPPHPLPDPTLTEPGFRVTPHPDAPADGAFGPVPRVANREEVAPGREPGLREPSLVAFTLMAQTAVGLLWAHLGARWLGSGAWAGAPGRAAVPALVAVGALTLAAMVASVFHLGRPTRARRALANLGSSWLSREILLVGGFTTAWAAFCAVEALGLGPAPLREALAATTGLAGLALVMTMARVYRLRTVPVWDTARTTAGFVITALVLGALALLWIRALTDGAGPDPWVSGAAFLVAAVAAVRARWRFYAAYARVGGA